MAPETRRPHTGGPRRRTTAEFIALAGLVHGEETYDYGKVNYQTTHEKVEIVCPEHGRFTQRPSAHLRGAGCPNCGLALRSTSQIYGGDRYVEQARNVHGDRYDYSQLGYHGQRHKITVICKEHGPFSQLPGNHLKGNGCPRCGNVQKGVSGRTEIGEFIDRATAIHGDGRYDYSQVVLTTQVTPVAIICHRHGIFRQRPHKHLQGDGCRACCESRGEREIRRVLKALGWDFVAQWSHPELRYKRPLYFDFVVPSRLVAIEFDGEHHRGPVLYRPDDPVSSARAFEAIRIRDAIKDAWAASEGWVLIRLTGVETVEDRLEAALGRKVRYALTAE